MEDERGRIEAAKADPSRFAELYDEHFERVYAYVLRRVFDRSDAQDITADVFQAAVGGERSVAPAFRRGAFTYADASPRSGRQKSVSSHNSIGFPVKSVARFAGSHPWVVTVPRLKAGATDLSPPTAAPNASGAFCRRT
jgi:hypothetical protein